MLAERKGRKGLGWFGVIAAGIVLTGCASGFSAQDDVRIVAKPDGLYLMARSPAIARSMCIASGLDAARVEGRMFAEGRTFLVGDTGRYSRGVQGCQMAVRNIIVCADGDGRCLLHEERHAREGAFHQ